MPVVALPEVLRFLPGIVVVESVAVTSPEGSPFCVCDSPACSRSNKGRRRVGQG